MPQQKEWEKEYRSPRLLTKGDEPQVDVHRFVRFLKKQKVFLEDARVIDLGCGTGRNANFFARMGARVVGIDIAPTAIRIARERARALGVSEYTVGSIGTPLAFSNDSFDLALDVTASNSLSEQERSVFLTEVHRILTPGGYFFVKALCKDGDKNAQALLKKYPGAEPDTYRFPGIGFIERVYSRADFVAQYGAQFEISTLEKKSNYAQFQGQPYKRNYWIAYLKKKVS